MKNNEYKCASCHNVYEKGWTDEEAEKEAKDIWGTIPQKEREVVCDDCFNVVSLQEIRAMGLEYQNNLKE